MTEISTIANRWLALVVLLLPLSACKILDELNPDQGIPSNLSPQAPLAAPTSAGANKPPANSTIEKELTPAHRAQEFSAQDQSRVLALRFQPLDVIKFSVWGYPELDHFAEVQPNGMVTLPLIGEVPATGITVEELRRAISERLKPFSHASNSELRQGDSLTLDVWQHSELGVTSIIDPQGNVTFPLCGQVPAAGHGVEEIRKTLEKRLEQYIGDARVSVLPTFNNRRVLYEPQVSVLAQKLEPRRVAMIGEVGVPGLLDIRGSLRAVDALAQAHVLDKSAKMNSIVVIRESDNGPQYRTLRIADYLAGAAPDENIYLQHKDIVIVPKTLITKVGDFVDQFVTKTSPIFSWWLALNQARVATDSADTVLLLNKALERQLLNVTVGAGGAK